MWRCPCMVHGVSSWVLGPASAGLSLVSIIKNAPPGGRGRVAFRVRMGGGLPPTNSSPRMSVWFLKILTVSTTVTCWRMASWSAVS
jgi:hypothetical protein